MNLHQRPHSSADGLRLVGQKLLVKLYRSIHVRYSKRDVIQGPRRDRRFGVKFRNCETRDSTIAVTATFGFAVNRLFDKWISFRDGLAELPHRTPLQLAFRSPEN